MALLLYLPFLGVVILANFGAESRTARRLTYAALSGWNLTMIAGGLLVLLNSLTGSPQVSQANNAALTLLLTGAVASLPLLDGVRRTLAQWLSLDPDSPLHATALVFAVYFAGLTMVQVQLLGDLSQLALPENRLSWWDVVFGNVPLLLIALAGVGLGLRRQDRYKPVRQSDHARSRADRGTIGERHRGSAFPGSAPTALRIVGDCRVIQHRPSPVRPLSGHPGDAGHRLVPGRVAPAN